MEIQTTSEANFLSPHPQNQDVKIHALNLEGSPQKTCKLGVSDSTPRCRELICHPLNLGVWAYRTIFFGELSAALHLLIIHLRFATLLLLLLLCLLLYFIDKGLIASASEALALHEGHKRYAHGIHGCTQLSGHGSCWVSSWSRGRTKSIIYTPHRNYYIDIARWTLLCVMGGTSLPRFT